MQTMYIPLQLLYDTSTLQDTSLPQFHQPFPYDAEIMRYNPGSSDIDVIIRFVTRLCRLKTCMRLPALHNSPIAAPFHGLASKRPGRPRRVAAGGTAATATSNREPSLSYTSSKNSSQGPGQPRGHESITPPPMPSYDPVISQTLNLSHAALIESSTDIAGGMWDKVLIDTYFETLEEPTIRGVGIAGLPQSAANNAERLASGSFLTSFTNEGMLRLPNDHMILTPGVDTWPTGMEWTTDGEAAVADQSAGSESSSQEPRTGPGTSDSLLSGLDQFIDQCNTLKHLTSSISGPLTLLANQAAMGMASTPDTTSSNSASANIQCLCDVALVNLQYHRHSLGQMRPERSLETCLHVQRILHWTSTMHRECLTCREDMVAILNVTCIARQVVQVYCSIVADQARERYNQGNKPAGSSSPMESTRLSLGVKLIQGSSKVNALSRLVGLKLLQMRDLLEEFQTRKSMEPSSENTESVQLLISGALERINVATGMLSTL